MTLGPTEESQKLSETGGRRELSIPREFYVERRRWVEVCILSVPPASVQWMSMRILLRRITIPLSVSLACWELGRDQELEAYTQHQLACPISFYFILWQIHGGTSFR